MRGVAIHIDLKPLSTRAWRSARAHKFIVDSGCRSNTPGIRTMLVIFSSIVSVLELAAAQSFVAFTTIASRAGRTRAARCLLAQHPRHTPMRGHVRPDAGEVGVDIVERRVRVSAEKQLLFQRAHPLLALVGRFHAHLVAAAPSAAASRAGAGLTASDRLWRGGDLSVQSRPLFGCFWYGKRGADGLPESRGARNAVTRDKVKLRYLTLPLT